MNWTEQQEQQFQSMLQLRQAATAEIVNAADSDMVESIQYGLYEDTNESDFWESFIKNESPFVVADMFEQFESSK